MIEVLLESWPLLASIVALLGISAFFSSSETAVFSLGPSRLAELANRNPVRAARIESLLEGRRSLLVTILLANLVVNVAYFNLGSLVAGRLSASGHELAGTLTPLFVLLGILLGGEVLPKSFAVMAPERVAGLAALPLRAIERVLAIPRFVLGHIADAVVRLLSGDHPPEAEVDEEELAILLQHCANEGSIATSERERLHGVLELGRTTLREVMTPRVDLAALPKGSDAEQVLALARTTMRRKILVYEESVDRVVGWVDVTTVLSDPKRPLSAMTRPIDHLPESATVATVLERYGAEGLRMAVIVDEYGGTEGLVTREDLVEAIVGEIADESDPDRPMIERESGGSFLVSARLAVQQLGRVLADAPRELGVDTVGGLVTTALGRLVVEGDTVRIGRLRFEVVSLRGRQPDRVRVRAAGRATRVRRALTRSDRRPQGGDEA